MFWFLIIITLIVFGIIELFSKLTIKLSKNRDIMFHPTVGYTMADGGKKIKK